MDKQTGRKHCAAASLACQSHKKWQNEGNLISFVC